MTRILTITLEVSDVEAATLLNQIADRGGIAASAPPNHLGHDTEDGEPDGNAPAVDANGIPWDKRIHSGNKKLNADGTWRRMRGIDDATFNRISAELKGAARPTDSSPPANAAPVAEPASTTPSQNSEPAAPVAAPTTPAMPGLPGLPSPADMVPPAPAPVTYEEVLERYKALAHGGKITQENYAKVYADAGITDPAALQTDESLRRKLMAVFDAL